ncbi:alpha/beta hydrolase [Mycobacterium sp. 236(2023)]|uniref:alpha/beta hydrolase n=1 Tax=Mycobacterium sp. 236(2023) TaxID=3038163 RepID=UPI0024158AB6|nr:alpha/beta hydrolase [Mycobacterium sp. 236(2023)]MDG4669410.1 alpha/beta hydrolase [Mycobacterium sp. 236(2023)]
MARQIPGFLQQHTSGDDGDQRSGPAPYSHEDTVEACEASLAGMIPRIENWPPATRTPPVVAMARQRERFLLHSSVSYGPHPAQVLDVWRSATAPLKPAPVLVFIPGGAWLYGKARHQGHALLSLMAARGWVCYAIDYRTSPRHQWPRHIMDVKAAVAWVRANAPTHGGDPGFVAVAGASAGGHLAALAALIHEDDDFGVESGCADAGIDAVVSFYGRYDWEDRSTVERDQFMGFLEHLVVKKTQASHPGVFRSASPMARINSTAPPFFVVHGSSDSIIPVAQARDFVDRLRTQSHSPVGYLELPGAQHAFDLFDGARTGPARLAAAAFLDAMYLRHSAPIAV